MVVADITKLGVAWANKLKDDAVGLVDAKAPDFMLFWMKFLGSQ